MSKYQTFHFKDYIFDSDAKTLKLYYSYDNKLEFCETYKFNFEFINYGPLSLDRAFQLLFFMAGISYYKMYLAPEIVIDKGEIDIELASFLERTYQNGLGEFFYMNNLDPYTPIKFPTNSKHLDPLSAVISGSMLVGLGGGKDSLVSVELLKDIPFVNTWALNHESQLAPLVDRIGLPHISVHREWDPQIKKLNSEDAMNGHVPISAIFACVGTVVSILGGFRDIVVSNESSASEPTMTYKGKAINHQYSKSIEFAKDFQECLKHLFGETVRYYSLLRPFTELRIAELFANLGFEKYKDVFSSCNRAFTHDQSHMFWCGECAKCAFVFLILTPFIGRQELEKLWGGKNLLLEPSLEKTYRQLLGIEGDKPFDCVGEVKESRAAMRLAQDIYPELKKYEFDLPEDYDFRATSKCLIPSEIKELLRKKVGVEVFPDC